MKRIIFTLGLFLSFQASEAQEKPYFEGEVTYEGLVNVDMKMLNFMTYNGKEKHKNIWKGRNMHGHDMRLNTHVIMSEDNDIYCIYSDELKEGIYMSFSQYKEENAKLMRRFNIPESPKVELIPNGNPEIISGIECNVYKSELDKNGEKSFNDYWLWTKYKYYEPIESGIQYKGLPIRQRTDLHFKKAHHYQMSRAIEVKEREVSLDEFKAPDDYKMVQCKSLTSFGSKIQSLFARHNAILKKEKRYPEALDDNRTYDIDGSWDD